MDVETVSGGASAVFWSVGARSVSKEVVDSSPRVAKECANLTVKLPFAVPDFMEETLRGDGTFVSAGKKIIESDIVGVFATEGATFKDDVNAEPMQKLAKLALVDFLELFWGK